MTTTPDTANLLLNGPSQDELHRLLNIMDYPTGEVIEDPIEILRTRALLTVAEFRQIMNVGRTTAYDMIMRGEVEVIRVGRGNRGIRVLAQSLARLLGDFCPHCGREGGA
jgi:hypothetical protein